MTYKILVYEEAVQTVTAIVEAASEEDAVLRLWAGECLDYDRNPDDYEIRNRILGAVTPVTDATY